MLVAPPLVCRAAPRLVDAGEPLRVRDLAGRTSHDAAPVNVAPLLGRWARRPRTSALRIRGRRLDAPPRSPFRIRDLPRRTAAHALARGVVPGHARSADAAALGVIPHLVGRTGLVGPRLRLGGRGARRRERGQADEDADHYRAREHPHRARTLARFDRQSTRRAARRGAEHCRHLAATSVARAVPASSGGPVHLDALTTGWAASRRRPPADTLVAAAPRGASLRS